MSRKIGLSVAQVGGINLEDSRATVVQRLLNLMKEAKSRGSSFVVYPELTLTTFFPRYWFDNPAYIERFFETSMPNDTVAPLFDLARELEIGFYLGYAELTSGGHRFNTSILVNRTGTLAGKYRKVHLPGHFDHKPDLAAQHLEKKYFEVGNLGFGVFDAVDAKMGMALCNDRRWPEVYRTMALQSAEIIVLGYNTPTDVPGWSEEPHAKMFTHLLSLQAGAYQNSVWVAAAGKCGQEDGHAMIGGSVIVAPSGEIVAKAYTEEDEVIFANIDLDMGEDYRQSVFNFAEHRRPENYSIIIERTGRGAPLPVPSDE